MIFSSTLEFWEFLSYLVTVLGLPLAMFVIWHQMRAERLNEIKEIEQRDDEIYVELSQQYSAFLETILANPDLNLMGGELNDTALSEAQKQKKIVYYEMLVALFERAFILLYEPKLSGNALRRWNSWADYMAWWLAKPDFCSYVERLLEGEDPEFAAYIQSLIGK